MSWLSQFLDKLLKRKPPVKPPAPPPVPPPTGSSAAQLLALHNTERAKRGMPLLALHDALQRAAQEHADWMAGHNKLTHFNDSDPWTRIRQAGYTGNATSENIAWNQRTAQEAVADWMSSPGHRQNILGAWQHVGFGYAVGKSGPYWCACFGSTVRAVAPESPEALPRVNAKHGVVA